MDIQDTLQQIREVKKVSRYRHKKRKNQTKKDFFIQKANNTCTYCGKTKDKKELCLIRKNHSLKSGQIFEGESNRIVACKRCASKKGKMNHGEFKKYLSEEKKQKRQEIFENYPMYAAKVFERYDYRCIYCEFEFGYTPEDIKLTIDHKDPVGQLGENDEENLACSCEKHNHEKGNHTAEEYFSYLERKGRKNSIRKYSK